MKRFTKSKKINIRSIYVGIVLFILFIAIFLIGVRFMNNGNDDRQLQALTSAIERDVMHCYALEGFYPPSLDYIESHYGLTYDKDAYIVDYQPIGNNIYPNYTIRRRDIQ